MKNKQLGGSLVEVMVGLFVGLLVMMTVFATFAFMEANKRTTVSGNSAFANLITGMQAIDHDIKMSGLGLSVKDFNTCTSLNAYFNGSVIADSGIIGPVLILSGGTAPDQITTFYGNSISGGAPTNVVISMGNATAPVAVNTSTDLQVGQLAMLMEPAAATPCTIVGVTAVQGMGNFTNITHSSSGSSYNPPNPDTVYTNSVRYSDTAVMLNLGTPRWQTWRVNNSRLEVLNQFTNTANEMVSDIVHLRAQYGVTDGVSESISQWVDATGEWANVDRAHIMRIRAIRMAMVARDPMRQKPTISGGACDATTNAPAPWLGAAAVDLSVDPNWQCYRYRVLKTVMPLKNIVWSTSV